MKITQINSIRCIALILSAPSIQVSTHWHSHQRKTWLWRLGCFERWTLENMRVYTTITWLLQRKKDFQVQIFRLQGENRGQMSAWELRHIFNHWRTRRATWCSLTEDWWLHMWIIIFRVKWAKCHQMVLLLVCIWKRTKVECQNLLTSYGTSLTLRRTSDFQKGSRSCSLRKLLLSTNKQRLRLHNLRKTLSLTN